MYISFIIFCEEDKLCIHTRISNRQILRKRVGHTHVAPPRLPGSAGMLREYHETSCLPICCIYIVHLIGNLNEIVVIHQFYREGPEGTLVSSGCPRWKNIHLNHTNHSTRRPPGAGNVQFVSLRGLGIPSLLLLLVLLPQKLHAA